MTCVQILVTLVVRISQLVAELFVVGITWWYTYQSYRIRKGVKIGKTISSILFYNGSLYFLLLATLYMLDVSFGTLIVSDNDNFQKFAAYLEIFIDPVASILTCHFILSLRQFDSTIASATNSGLGPQLREHIASTVLQFGAQPSESIPALIASFAHPVHIDASLFEWGPDTTVELGEMDAVSQAFGTPLESQSPERDQTPISETPAVYHG